MRIALVLNGLPPGPRALQLLDACEAIVCADGGANPVIAAKRKPAWIVGDLDSIHPTALKIARALGAQIAEFPREKNQTDGELALQQALALTPTHLVILGGHGGRTAMFEANLGLLRAAHEAGVQALMAGKDEVLRFASPGRDLVLARQTGAWLSVLAQGAPATITLEGFRYPLDHATLAPTSARGVSNVVTADPARVVVHEGLALTILEEPQDRSSPPPPPPRPSS